MVSVVVPAYNAMPYLKDCLDSILSQSYCNLQVLVINDGSSDGTADYLASVADDRVLTISVENAGVSAARNLGLESALGEWVTFVDADDLVEPYFVEGALDFAVKEGLDVAVGGLTKDYGSRQDLVGTAASEDEGGSRIYEEAGLLKVIEKTIAYSVSDDPFLSTFFMSGSVCKLINKRVIEGLRFDPDISVGEDTLFNVTMLQRCLRVGFITDNWYTYRIRRGSALGRYNPEAFKASEKLLTKLIQALPARADDSFWPPCLIARGLRQFEGACFSSIGHTDSGTSLASMRSCLGETLSNPFWASLFSDSERWLPYVKDRRYRMLGRLCAHKRLGVLCLYIKLLTCIRRMRIRQERV